MTFREQIADVARKNLLFTLHALDQMNKPDRLIAPEEVSEVVLRGEIIVRPVHVVCSPKQDYLAIITAYLPSTEEWSEDFRTRRE